MTAYRFTVLIAIFNVEQYLRSTLASLEKQTYGLDRIEVVLVNDGSSDSSGAIADAWAQGRSNVKVYHQDNAGPGAARNRGLQAATGEWVTSIDGDDLVDREYFAAASALIDRDGESRISIIAPRIYLLDDSTGRFRDKHPLGQKFRFGDRLARLADEPEAFVLSSTFMVRREALAHQGLRYDESLVPTFEDAHLIGRYLATCEDPVVGIAASAHYFYRKRSAGGSLVQSGWRRIERFSVVPERGYLDMLRSIESTLGHVPRWAQYMVLYDLLWYLNEDRSMSSKVGWLSDEQARRFIGLLDQIMSYVELDTLEQFVCSPLPWSFRQAMIARYFGGGDVVPRVFRWSDEDGMARATMFHRGTAPTIEAFADAVEVDVLTVGTQRHSFFGADFAVERSIEFKSGADLALRVDGVDTPFRPFRRPSWGRPPEPTYRLEPADKAPEAGTALRSRLAGLLKAVRVASAARRRSVSRTVLEFAKLAVVRRWRARKALARRRWVASMKHAAAMPEVRARLAHSWIVMDRVGTADDNGEHLYRYLKNERPDIDAYFLLERSSTDWDRLSAEGFRMVEYGSDEAAVIALNASVRISSDAVEGCMYPVPRREFGGLPGIFVFLQHGVLKDDISRWLNGKNIELLITTTDREYESFVDEESPYSLHRRQVVQTGLARYDRLMELRAGSAVEGRTVLFMPTWRRSLRDALVACASDEERVDVFRASEFGRRWLDLLSSPEVARVAQDHGGSVRLMLHPVLDHVVPEFDLPAHVERLDPSKVRFQEELARTSMLVTDYTSVAFDVAYLGAPVLYYQFDEDTMFNGDHPLRKGYFDYRDDGLGPVWTTHEDTARSIEEYASRAFSMEESYRVRTEATFRYRDVKNAERIVSAIERRRAEVSPS